MKIINLAVRNGNLFIDKLEYHLCRAGISYVKVENEMHFLDKIVRIYEYLERLKIQEEDLIAAIMPIPVEQSIKQPVKYSLSDIKKDNKATNQKLKYKLR